ncbi:MAG: hypothetical protein CEO22_364 [Candidatus Berkelbacteria bacterium Gr01-1014_85]|uniref:RNA polymerase sigma-70 region 2 domain-containing protein n=1 Tax=Candidatus Berkelbacteria bacterium Gr01-1014_85 TaxID=2017150 RepID=A0A554JBQ9_9BACT|nr:MAG: hypothetical protein CEO22_364 [Candidatus Berkelbacteria bacterium Gr01-1014_85]
MSVEYHFTKAESERIRDGYRELLERQRTRSESDQFYHRLWRRCEPIARDRFSGYHGSNRHHPYFLDVYQEFCLEVFKLLVRYDPERGIPFGNYFHFHLNIQLKWSCSRFQRHIARRHDRGEYTDEQLAELYVAPPSAEPDWKLLKQACFEHLLARVEAALAYVAATTSVREATIEDFRMHVLNGVPQSEIATARGVSRANISMGVNSMRKRVLRYLDNHPDP